MMADMVAEAVQTAMGCGIAALYVFLAAMGIAHAAPKVRRGWLAYFHGGVAADLMERRAEWLRQARRTRRGRAWREDLAIRKILHRPHPHKNWSRQRPRRRRLPALVWRAYLWLDERYLDPVAANP